MSGERTTQTRISEATTAGGDERKLVERVRARDLQAFEILYKLYHPRLTKFLMNMTRRPSLVDEVINDAMMVVWQRADSFDGTSKLSSWIFGIAYRTALKALRKQDVPIEDELADARASPDATPEESAARQRTARAVQDVLEHLSADHRAVVALTYFDDFGYRDIAKILDCPADTVKTRMFYARKHLRRLLQGDATDWL